MIPGRCRPAQPVYSLHSHVTILLAIDGTGPWDDDEYAEEFGHSHVRKIWYHTQATRKRYLRGPSMLGSEMSGLVRDGLAFVEDRRRDDEPILLTGYSRGAAAVVAIARELSSSGARVAGLMLFDCVNRAVGFNTDVLPTNVDEVRHVRRHWDAGSRESFGHSGSRLPAGAPPPRYEQSFHLGTHGALGGVPWRGTPAQASHLIYESPDGLTNITYADDAVCSREVWNAVRPFLYRLGFLGPA